MALTILLLYNITKVLANYTANFIKVARLERLIAISHYLSMSLLILHSLIVVEYVY